MPKLSAVLFCCLLLASCGEPKPRIDYSGPVAGWPEFGNTDGTRFSPLTQITPGNVAALEPAWEYHTGDYAGARDDAGQTSFSATPILDNNTLYFCSGLSRLFAVDAETGQERWVYDAEPEHEAIEWTKTCRGVALWKSREGQGVCKRRLFMGTLDGGLVSVDAQTGKACADFGESGRVDITAGLGDVRHNEVRITSVPVVYGDLVISGHMVADFSRADSPGGVIRGWDVRSGELRWAFDPVPPGTRPLPDNPDGSPNFHRGTANAWSILTVDQQRGIVYVPLGSANIDYTGGHKKDMPVDVDYYANSLVALNALSGEVLWSFQAVHHDLWDFDMSAQPSLIEVWKEGEAIPAVAQATKMGHLFLLHRETGEPLYPVEERPVPQTDVAGEYTSPTQPFPTFPPPLHPGKLEPEDAWGFTFYDKGYCRDKLATHRNEGIFTPPSERGSIHYPGMAGGSNWGGVAFDPERRWLVLNQNEVASVKTVLPKNQFPHGEIPEEFWPMEGTDFAVKFELLLSPFGVPCFEPPWGTLMAVSLDTGEKVWEVPFGTTRDMVPGLSVLPFGLNYGLPSAGGPIITASGLVFIGASLDNYLRAYDIESGEELWRGRLPAGGQAIPMTYRLAADGKQYVVIAAGGHSAMHTKLGDSLIAYALPD